MKKISQRIFAVCVVLTLLFIWGNSLLPGDVSTVESGWVQKLLGPILDYLQSGQLQVRLNAWAMRLPSPLVPAALRLVDAFDQGFLQQYPSVQVRKAAHFAEYMLLGWFMGLLCVRRDGRRRFFLPEGLCLAAALVDECIQLFIPGRSAQLRDVCIDLSGATLGLLLVLLLLAVIALILRWRTPDIGKTS